MNLNRRRGRLGSLRVYLPKALKFYNLKVEYFTPAVFTLMLLVSFLGNFLPLPMDNMDNMDIMAQTDPKIMIVYIFIGIIMKLALTVYLAANIRELKGEPYTLGECFKLVMRRSFKILAASAIYSVLTTVAIVFLALSNFAVLALPILVIYIMFLFHTCYIIDKNCSIAASFKYSRNITKRYKWRIFIMSFAFSLIFIFISLFILGMFIASGSTLIYSFVTYFLLTLFNLMNEKFIALMYYDLEYGENTLEQMSDI